METLYQTVDRSGISIPLEIIRAYDLPEGTRVAISLQKDGIHVTPTAVSIEEIENRALRYKICANPRRSAAVFDSECQFSPAPTFCQSFGSSTSAWGRWGSAAITRSNSGWIFTASE